MPTQSVFSRRNCYRDPLSLYLAARDVKRLPGVLNAFCATGEPANIAYAGSLGFRHTEFNELAEGDLFGAVSCVDEAAAQLAIGQLQRAALGEPSLWDRYNPSSLDGALRLNPALNLAVVSNRSRRAKEIARDCLLRGLNVLAITDTIELEDEIELKRLASSKGLLLLGPDCRTAVLGGVPLGFANVVRSGGVGAIAVTGTGLQKFCCHVDALANGISAAIGCGRRDLDIAVGGASAKQGLAALGHHTQTRVVALLLKAFERDVCLELLAQAAELGKPVVVYAQNLTREEIESAGLSCASSLFDCALRCVAFAAGEPEPAAERDYYETDPAAVIEAERAGKSGAARYIRGFFLGGDLCDEVSRALAKTLEPLWSNAPVRPLDKLADPETSQQNCCIDFGDALFTMEGRLSPLLEPAARDARLVAEGRDKQLAVAIVDCVLGYGCYAEAAAELASAIARAKQNAAAAGNSLSVIVVLVGSEKDPLPRSNAKMILQQSGAVVTASALEAAELALGIQSGLNQGKRR